MTGLNGYELVIGDEESLDSRRKAESRIGGDLSGEFSLVLSSCHDKLILESNSDLQ